jgi:hypothetical protein
MKLTGQVYLCSAGETFDSVALALYGEEAYAADLLNANPALCRKPIFTGGENLYLPVVDLPEDESGNTYMPAKAPWKE